MLKRHLLSSAIILLTAIQSLTAADPVYVESNGLIVIEAERAFLMGDTSKSGFELRTELNGYSGEGYLFWNAGNRYSAPGSDILRYRLFIETPGRYELSMHVSSKGAAKHDLNNDCWLRMDDDKWYKTFQSSTEGWRWGGSFDHHAEGMPRAYYQLSAGEHVLHLTGRSQGFHIDRIHLYRDTRKSDAKSLSLRETNNIPVPPKSLSNEKIKQAWFAGQLGAVWAWADKQQEKDPEAAAIVPILSDSFDKQFTDIQAQFADNPLQAYTNLKLCAEQWGAGPKEPKKQLKDLMKEWGKDKRLKEEIKANSVVQKLIALRSSKDDSQTANIAQGDKLLQEKFGETQVVKDYLARYK